jgi:hypothetical protein
METGFTEYYWAPLSLDPFVFNSKIRRRNLDDLIDRLVEEGKAHWPSAEDGLASVEEETEPAQTPTNPTTPTTMTANVAVGSPVHDVAKIDKQPRPASSVYSRDIDGNSYRSASTVQDLSSRSASFGSLLPPLISLNNSGESSNTSFVVSIDPDHLFPAEVEVVKDGYKIYDPSVTYPDWDDVGRFVPAPLNFPRPGKYGGYSRGSPANSEKIPVTAEPSTPERDSNSTSSTSSTRATTNSSPASASQGSYKGSSSRTSLSSPAKSISSSATSASNIGTPCEVSNVPKRKRHWSRRLLASMMKTFRSTNFRSPSFQSTSTKSISVTDSDAPGRLGRPDTTYPERSFSIVSSGAKRGKLGGGVCSHIIIIIGGNGAFCAERSAALTSTLQRWFSWRLT